MTDLPHIVTTRGDQRTLYPEDFAVGDEFSFGSHTVTKAEIVEFGGNYDPQPFHGDEQALQESMFGGLVASGWDVVSLTQRLVSGEIYLRSALRAGKRTDAVTFKAPTRPGDTLSGTVEIVGITDPRVDWSIETSVSPYPPEISATRQCSR